LELKLAERHQYNEPLGKALHLARL